MRWLVILIFVAPFFCSHAQAAAFSASQLYDLCNSPAGSPADDDCTSYVGGFAAGFLAAQLLSNGKPATCVPADITGTQARLVVEKYMRINPEHLNVDAMTFLTAAFVQAFPCSRPDKPGN